jgi:monofunctional biosynthetic peptidoglycan transglycosylase
VSLLRRPGRLLLLALASTVMVTLALVAPLRWVAPVTSAFMLQSWAREARAPRHDWVARERISRHAALAVIAAEDQRFARHAGFDLEAIEKALRHNQRGGSVKGASTLSQQVAKNLFLWPGRSWLRKGLEAWFTAWLELLLPKARILELHLNLAQFGPRVFGVEAASRLYFGRSAARLDHDQAALLAAVLPNPERFSVARPSRYVRTRQHWIRQQALRVERSGVLRAIGWQVSR